MPEIRHSSKARFKLIMLKLKLVEEYGYRWLLDPSYREMAKYASIINLSIYDTSDNTYILLCDGCGEI